MNHNQEMGNIGSPPPMGMHGGRKKMMMHMTFYWGKDALILFKGWPGMDNAGMYAAALIFVFALAVFVEFLSHCRLIRKGTRNIAAGIIQTGMHAIRVFLAYLVMLAVMSFNVGVLLVAIAGHTLGFLLFGSRVFKKIGDMDYEKTSDLPPMSC